MAKYRILVIEDDMDVAELLLMYFESQNYEVLHSDVGAGGIALARSKLPNLILLDVMLPDMDGFDVCYELRNTNLTRYIPTIFLTQRNARADKVSGLELGADDYITKPFDIEELRLRVQGSIQRATRDLLYEPVTGLPTGHLIESVAEKVRQGDTCHRLDIQVEGFDAFRDAYGFLTANDALGLASRILSTHLTEQGTSNDFIGTPSPASFVVFTYMNNPQSYVEQVKSDFAERVRALYKFTDADQGYILIGEGSSSEVKAPLMHFNITTRNAVSA